MGKVRVHELARKLNMSNQEVIAKLNAKGVIARTHSSSVDEAEAKKALGLMPSESAKAERPRTVLRRRKDQAEEMFSAEHVEEEGLRNEREPKVVTEEKQEIFAPPVSEIVDKTVELAENKEEALGKPSSERSSAVPQKETDVSLANKEPEGEVFHPRVIKDSKVTPPKAGPESAPSNVVRVIDAEAIKARLASEGRSFHRRGSPPRPGTSGAPSGAPSFGARSGARPHTAERVSAPPPVNVASPESGQRPGGRPSKKKKGGTGSYSREMRDTSSGGRELWLAPGRKKRSALKTKGRGTVLTQAAAHKRVIEMTDAISVNDLAHRMAIKAGQVVSKCC